MNKFEFISELRDQEQFLTVLKERINRLSILKRETFITDLELGAEIGYIQRLMVEYHSNLIELNKEIISFLDE